MRDLTKPRGCEGASDAKLGIRKEQKKFGTIGIMKLTNHTLTIITSTRYVQDCTADIQGICMKLI